MQQETRQASREDGISEPQIPVHPLGLEPVEGGHVRVRVEHGRGGVPRHGRRVHDGGRLCVGVRVGVCLVRGLCAGDGRTDERQETTGVATGRRPWAFL